MNILAIDTATPALIVGVVCDGVTRSETVLNDSHAHNELLVPATLRMLDDAHLTFSDLDAIVVGVGPGPFTGLRVGMATAAAFGDARHIPVYGVPTHDAIAHNVGNPKNLVVATDARRKEVYWSSYCGGQRVAGPEVCQPARLGEPVPESDHRLGRVDVMSVPAKLAPMLPAALQAVTVVSGVPLPADLVAVADFTSKPEPLQPLYLRRPDAKEPTKKAPSPAIVRKEP